MGLVLQWLGTLLANIAAFFGISLAKKAALGTAAVAASVLLFFTLATAIKGMLAVCVATLPSWADKAFIFFPSNMPACVSAIMAAKFAVMLYQWNLTNLKIISTIN